MKGARTRITIRCRRNLRSAIRWVSSPRSRTPTATTSTTAPGYSAIQATSEDKSADRSTRSISALTGRTPSLDHRHTFVSSVLWDLPFGHGKRFGADVNTLTDKFIGGWQWNVIFEGSTGSKFSVISNGRPANQIGPAFTNGRLDPAGFDDGSSPADPNSICYTNLAGNQFCYGDSGRNRFTGPGYFRTDMSLFKNLTITERVSMQIGLEGFNIFNQANALVPNATWNTPGAGQTVQQANPNFGFFQNTWLPPRIIQYRARIIF